MRILFDHGAGWDQLVNGELLKAAEEARFDVLLTTDKNMVAQQNLKTRSIAIVVLGNSQWRIVQRYVWKDSGYGECRDTRRLCRGRYSFKVALQQLGLR